MNKNENVTDVSSFLKIVSNMIEQNDNDNLVTVFRGETEEYTTACQPNLFRNNILKENELFEKNIFDEMSANKITSGENYLEKAIDAQHGGFPSRLLDVSYNCLVALYFATTPFYHKPEDSKDSKDGVVYIYYIEKVFCPTGSNIVEAYDAIVRRKKEYYITSPIFQNNHKLIDHIKINNRIIAQQGAFIIFQGDEIMPISKAKYKKIIIKNDSKKRIRAELRKLFGIYTGTIYPEPENLVDEIISKSNRMNNIEFSVKDELNLTIENLNIEINYYIDCILKELAQLNRDEQIVSLLKDAEDKIYGYKMGLLDLKQLVKEETEESSKNINLNNINNAIERYQFLVKEFYQQLKYFLSNRHIDFSEEEITITKDDERNE